MSKTYHIETERLIIRDMRTTDLDDMFKLDSDPLVHKYLGNKPFTKKSQSQKYIDDVIEDYKAYGTSRWATIEKATGKFIGWTGLRYYPEKYQYNGRYGFYDVGYRLMPEFWAKGYATEASIAALEYGFKVLKLDAIYGLTEIENEASHRVLLKIGLTHTETFFEEKLKEELRWYELKKEDYEKKMS